MVRYTIGWARFKFDFAKALASLTDDMQQLAPAGGGNGVFFFFFFLSPPSEFQITLRLLALRFHAAIIHDSVLKTLILLILLFS